MRRASFVRCYWLESVTLAKKVANDTVNFSEAGLAGMTEGEDQGDDFRTRQPVVDEDAITARQNQLSLTQLLQMP